MRSGRQERGKHSGGAGQLTLRLGHSVVHGLTLSEAKEWVAESSTRVSADSATGAGRVVVGEETTEELSLFASWYEDLDEHCRSDLPKAFKNAARNLVRHRGSRVHKVPT